MTLRVLRVASIVSALGLAVTLGLAWATRVDPVAHARYDRALRATRELDARLSEEVAKSRLGIVGHYDALVRTDDQIEAVLGALDRVPAFVPGEDRAVLRERLDAYRASVRRKQALVETFKTEEAVLRSSRRAFPHGVERVLERLRAEVEAAPLVLAIEQLQHDVLMLPLAPGRERVDRARCDLHRLGAGIAIPDGGCAGPPVELPAADPEIRSVVHHGQIVVERHGPIEQLVSRIMTLPVSSRAAEAYDAYAAIHGRAEERSRARWLTAYAFSICFLLVGAAYIIVRLRTSAAALRDTTGRLEQALKALQKEREREIELANLKSRVVSMTSHEFRTPLSVILSSAELLEAYGDRWPADKRIGHLKKIEGAAADMSRMLDRMLLIGRAEAGMLELNPQPIRLGELTDALVDELRGVVGERRLRYLNEAPSGTVWLDEKLVRHVLTNLLSNAFKYSPDDTTVHFEVRQRGGEALFDIMDEGIGIPEEEQSRLFTPFHRCSNAVDVPGSGLGLAIAKRSVEVHGGSITLDSRVGRGTRFQVRIPYAEARA